MVLAKQRAKQPEGRLEARRPTAKKGTRVSNSHKVTDSGQRALSGQECAWKSDKCFALDLHHLYF